jgi:hypothetical protein
MAFTKEEMKEYQRQWMKERRQEYLDYLGGKCVQCGVTENLHFDHIDASTKKYAINKIASRKKEFVYEELKKCQLLCQKCHMAKSGADIASKLNGELSPFSKVSDLDRRYIRYHRKETYQQIEKRLGITKKTVWRYLQREDLSPLSEKELEEYLRAIDK